MLDYPLETFVQFCHNHGLLQILDRPIWRTVRGGSREYVNRMAKGIGSIRTNAAVESVSRELNGVSVRTAASAEVFDQVVFATHADQTLRILGSGATSTEREILGALPYQPNRAVLHTDPALLPRNARLWSAWNYLADGNALGEARHNPVSVSYLINKLQPLPFNQPVVVTLNPLREPAPEHVIAEFDYDHPLFDAKGVAAQSALNQIQGSDRIWFSGAWTGYGFHEDGLKSGMTVAAALGADIPWHPSQTVAASASSEPEYA